MKKCAWVMLLCLLLTACTSSTSYKSTAAELTGLDLSGSTIVSEKDTHGGFLGDGELCVVFDCASIADSMAQQTKNWRRFPLSENLQMVIYGGTKDGGVYMFDAAEEFEIPEISNGCYYFINRQASKADAQDDTFLFYNASFNFSLFLYDEDACRLYYYELDT